MQITEYARAWPAADWPWWTAISTGSGWPAAKWRSETRAWHEELLAVIRLPDAAARRRCEATLRTGRLV